MINHFLYPLPLPQSSHQRISWSNLITPGPKQARVEGIYSTEQSRDRGEITNATGPLHSVKNRRNRVERVGCLVEKAAHTCSKTEWSLNAAGVPGCRVKSSAGIRSLSLSLFLSRRREGGATGVLFVRQTVTTTWNERPTLLFIFPSSSFLFFFSFFFSLSPKSSFPVT